MLAPLMVKALRLEELVTVPLMFRMLVVVTEPSARVDTVKVSGTAMVKLWVA